MSIKNIQANLGEYARDIKLNLGNVLSEEGAADLSHNQIYGIALAAAYATRQAELIDALLSEAESTLSEAEIHATKIAAAIMGMNNVYYRFVHLVSNKDYAGMPANLRMNAVGNPGIEKVDFELYSLAVSAINGCGMCIDAHVRELEKACVSKSSVQSCIRIAAVINAAAQALTIN